MSGRNIEWLTKCPLCPQWRGHFWCKVLFPSCHQQLLIISSPWTLKKLEHFSLHILQTVILHEYHLNKLGICHSHQHTFRVIDRLAVSHDTLLKRRKSSAEARDQKEADTSANTPAQHEMPGQVVNVQSHCSSQSSEDEDTSSPSDTVVYIMMFHSPSHSGT